MRELSPVEERIAALADKARSAQKNGLPDIDWTRPAALPIWLPRRVAAKAITQYYHGERATARACDLVGRQITNSVARDFLVLQAEDERRHARLYQAYLNKIGGAYPRSMAIEATYQRALSWTGAPEAIILAFHAILEGESLRLQQIIDKWMPCPLFRQIGKFIARDEARHLAFGRLYLRHALPQMPRCDRLAIFRWARALWFGAIRNAIGEFVPPGLFRAGGGYRRWLATEWEERLDELQALNLFTAAERNDFAGP